MTEHDSGIDVTRVWEQLAQDGGRIVYVLLDGAGGIPFSGVGMTALTAAATPHLDELARLSCCGLLETVAPASPPEAAPAIYPYSATIRCAIATDVGYSRRWASSST